MLRRTSALAVTLAFAFAAPAVAQTRPDATGTTRPSASGLWKKYPLHPPQATATAADATPVAERTEKGSSAPDVRSSDDGSGWSPVLTALIVVLAVATAGVWTLVLLRRRRGTPRPNGRRGALPPDPQRPWTASIDWVEDGAGAHFRVVARAKDEESTILRSAVLPWPPTDSGAVDAMTTAVERLELRLLDAGWARAEPGPAWYEKHFAWTPKPAAPPPRPAKPEPAPKPKAEPKPKPAAQAPQARAAQAKPEPPRPSEAPRRPAPERAAGPAAAVTASRFAPHGGGDWPAEAEGLWRCEIRFDAGYSASRFTAMVQPPAGSDARSRVVARSEPLRWLFMSLPDAKVSEHRSAALALARALRAAGWEVVGRGGGWYAERYVWRGEGEPPAHVEVPAQAGQQRGERA
jgi:hypothetical protein